MKKSRKTSLSQLEAEVRSQKVLNQILISALINSSRKIAELEEIADEPIKHLERETARLKKYQDARFRALNTILEQTKKVAQDTPGLSKLLMEVSKSQSKDFKSISAEYWKHVHKTEDDPTSCWRPEIDYVAGFLEWFFGRADTANAPLSTPDKELDFIMMEVRQQSDERLIKGLERTIELLNETLLKKIQAEEDNAIDVWHLQRALNLTQDPEWYWKEKPTPNKPFGVLKSWGEIKDEISHFLKGSSKGLRS